MLSSFITSLNWREPLWLLLLLQPVIVFLLQKIKNKSQLNRYADQRLHPWVLNSEKKRLVQLVLQRKSVFLIAWILFSIAMAGPRTALERPGDVIQTRLDIMLVVDLSQSMRATDVKPGRIQRVQIELYELLHYTQYQRIGMVVFAARPHVYFPLTADKSISRFYLQSLDEITLPTHGSNVIDALQMGADELSRNSKTAKAILLVSDGDFDLSGNKQDQLNIILANLKEKDIPLYILGVGSVEGEAIPQADGSWLMEKGNAIVSHLDDTLLKNMASETGGRYSVVTKDNSDWQALYFNGIHLLQRSVKTDEKSSDIIWYEYYPWLLMPGILLFFIASLPFRLDLTGFLRNTSRTMIMSCLLPVLIFSFDRPAYASGLQELRDAGLSFKTEEYSKARDLYKAINGYEARFGEGASRYRMGDYTGAIRQFSQAVLETSKPHQQAKALYNLANSYYQTGNYQSAVDVYNDVLRYKPADEASIRNRDVSLLLLHQIEERLQLERAARAGNGPTSGTTADGTDISESSRISIGDDEVKDSVASSIPEMPGISNDNFEKLVQKGIKYIKVAASGSTVGKQHGWQQVQFEARFMMQGLEDNNAKHMQRLFEMEEGFAAPVVEPVNIPGVQPW